jgi:spore coat protein A
MSTLGRREFLKRGAIAGAGLTLPLSLDVASAGAMPARGIAALPLANSDFLVKWIQPIRGLGPTGIQLATPIPDPVMANTVMYNITASEYTDTLHPQLGPTRLFGYHDTVMPDGAVPHHLSGLIIATRGIASRIRVTNALPARHIIPVDTTIMGANQAQNRITNHLHGGLVPWVSDGGPFSWFDPVGNHGSSFLNGPLGVFDNIPAMPLLPGQADYYYPNNQGTRLEWYHDHAVGITRINAYAGIATGYLIIDPAQEAFLGNKVPPFPGSVVPVIFQDKVFVSSTTKTTDPTWATVARPDVQGVGNLWYAHVYDPKLYRMFNGQMTTTPPNPSIVPEFFGDTMLCNGTVYPFLTVEAKRYRMFVLNACNARFLNINTFVANPANPDGIDLNPKTLFPNNPAGPNIIQIGTEGGYLVSEVTHVSPKPFNPATMLGNLLMAPAERADVIIDFTGRAGQEIILYNDAPAPFPAGPATNDYYLGNPKNPVQPLAGTGPDTRQLLRIKVIPATVPDPQPTGPILNPVLMDPAPLAPITTTVAPIPPLVAPTGTPVRDLTLNEKFDGSGRLIQLLGTTTAVAPNVWGRAYVDAPTEVIAAGSTEVWRIFNTTADTHPIHFHLVNVQVLSRQAFKLDKTLGTFTPSGVARGPEPNELGWKETVRMNPGEVTTVVMKFDLPVVPFAVPSSPRATASPTADPNNPGMGLAAGPTYHEYVWHCHILEHEEHDMMRPLVVKS